MIRKAISLIPSLFAWLMIFFGLITTTAGTLAQGGQLMIAGALILVAEAIRRASGKC